MTTPVPSKIFLVENSSSLMNELSEERSSNNLGKWDVNDTLLDPEDTNDDQKHKEDINNAESESVGSKEYSIESDVNTNISSLSNGDYRDNNNDNRRNNNNINNQYNESNTTIALQTNIEYAKKVCIEKMHDLLKLRSEPDKAIENIKEWEEILTPDIEFHYPTTNYRPFPPHQMDLGNCRRILRGISSIVEDTVSLGVFLNLLIPCPIGGINDINDTGIEFPDSLGMGYDDIDAGGAGTGTSNVEFQNGSHVKYEMKLIKGTTVVSVDIIDKEHDDIDNNGGDDDELNEIRGKITPTGEGHDDCSMSLEVDADEVETSNNYSNCPSRSNRRRTRSSSSNREEEKRDGTYIKLTSKTTSKCKSNEQQITTTSSSASTNSSRSNSSNISENSVSKLKIKFTLMSQWTLKTTNATACGAPVELTKTGMLYANYNSDMKISNMHILFDVMGFVQQLRRLKSSMKMWTGLGLGLGTSLGRREPERVGSRGSIPLPSIATSASASSSSPSSNHSRSNKSAMSTNIFLPS